MERYWRHRYALALPFLVLALVAIVGGILNGVPVRGRLVDDFTEEPAKDGELSLGRRSTRSLEDGSFVLAEGPRLIRTLAGRPVARYAVGPLGFAWNSSSRSMHAPRALELNPIDPMRNAFLSRPAETPTRSVDRSA